MPIRLVVADDHPLILNALEQLFTLAEGFEIMACCQDGEETLQAVRNYQPDVLILDVRMPGMDGLAVLRELRHEQCPTRVILLTGALEESEALEAAQLGVQGVVLKEMAPQLLMQCVRKVHDGGEWFERQTVSRMISALLRHEASMREVMDILTPRELAIVRLVAQGLRNKGIADALGISEGTVKIHLHNIYKKLLIDGRLALTLYARDKGLV